MELRPYQQQLVGDARSALSLHSRVLTVLPTGGGKTQIFVDIAYRAATKGRRVLILVHRRELMQQARLRLGAGHALIEVHSIQTVVRKYKWKPDLVIVDEAHHVMAKTWREALEALNAPVLGFTATPQRLDGKGLGEQFGAMVLGPNAGDLMQMGFLSGYKLFCPPGRADLSGIKKRGGDYAKNELNERVDTRRVLAAAVKNYKLLGGNRQAIGFCVSISHAEHMCDAFNEAGIPADMVDGSMNAKDRDLTMKAFRDGAIRVLLSVDLISEGFDVPACDCVLLMRPTASLSLYLQQVGRALRPSNQHAVILDCCGNAEVHGLPDMDREWSLEGTSKERKGLVPNIAVRVCPVCYGVHKPAPVCPYCGHIHAVDRAVPVEEDVLLIDRTEELKQKRAEVGRARNRDALLKIAADRGYKPGWVDRVIASRR